MVVVVRDARERKDAGESKIIIVGTLFIDHRLMDISDILVRPLRERSRYG